MLTIEDLYWASSLSIDDVRKPLANSGIAVEKITSVRFLGFNPGGSFAYEICGGHFLDNEPVWQANLAFSKLAKWQKNNHDAYFIRGDYQLYWKT